MLSNKLKEIVIKIYEISVSWVKDSCIFSIPYELNKAMTSLLVNLLVFYHVFFKIYNI